MVFQLPALERRGGIIMKTTRAIDNNMLNPSASPCFRLTDLQLVTNFTFKLFRARFSGHRPIG